MLEGRKISSNQHLALKNLAIQKKLQGAMKVSNQKSKNVAHFKNPNIETENLYGISGDNNGGYSTEVQNLINVNNTNTSVSKKLPKSPLYLSQDHSLQFKTVEKNNTRANAAEKVNNSKSQYKDHATHLQRHKSVLNNYHSKE